MKITNNQVFAAQGYLAELKLSQFNKETRLAIFKNVGELSVAVKAVQDKMEASKKELFKDLDEQAQKVGALREEFNKEETSKERKDAIIVEIGEYEDYLKAEREFVEITNKFGNDEVEINLATIDFNDFVEGLIESEIDFNALQLQRISFMFKKVK